MFKVLIYCLVLENTVKGNVRPDNQKVLSAPAL